VESASRGDIQSVNHKTAPPRKPLSPEICPGYAKKEGLNEAATAA
jgi:hypothetical protein